MYYARTNEYSICLWRKYAQAVLSWNIWRVLRGPVYKIMWQGVKCLTIRYWGMNVVHTFEWVIYLFRTPFVNTVSPPTHWQHRQHALKGLYHTFQACSCCILQPSISLAGMLNLKVHTQAKSTGWRHAVNKILHIIMKCIF